MAVSAKIKFVQGVLTPNAGLALLGALTTAVVCSNDNNGDAKLWTWNIIAKPPGSAVTLGQISASSTATFQPDVRGGYHVELIVTDENGVSVSDRSVFEVPELSGLVIPPFFAGKDELNFGGQAQGWDPYMREVIQYLQGRSALVNSATGAINDMASTTTLADGRVLFEYAMKLTGAAPSLNSIASPYDGRMLRITSTNAWTLVNNGSGTAANTVQTGTGANIAYGARATALLYYDGNGASPRWTVCR